MIKTLKKWIAHAYQRIAIAFLLANPKSGLFLDPGLGKTSISLATIKILKFAGLSRGVLMIAPLRVTYSVWPNEIEKWTNFHKLTNTILHDNNKQSLWGPKKDIYLINPEGLPWLHGELLEGLSAGKKCPFDVLWIDESTKFKSATSARFSLLKDMLPLFKRRHIMTGTPSPRGLLDLWSQLYILDEGETLCKNYYKFRNQHFQADDWNKYNWYLREGHDTIIHELISPIILEMSSKDYLDMPPITFNNIFVELPNKTINQYKQMEKEFFLELDNIEVSAEATAQASMKCHQIANGYVYEDIPVGLDESEELLFRKKRKAIKIHKAKIEALQNLIEELNGKPVLIAYHYKHDLKAIRDLLGENVPHIGSGVSQEEMQQIERDWNKGKLQFLVGHPASMGHGLNLQAASNDICWFSLTWNLEEYLQFNARIYRQGVSGAVRIHHLIAENTIDEAILLRLGDRAKSQTDLRLALKNYRKSLQSK